MEVIWPETKKEGFWVRVVDIVKQHEFWNHNEICDEYVSGDLRDPKIVEKILVSLLMKFTNLQLIWAEQDIFLLVKMMQMLCIILLW